MNNSLMQGKKYKHWIQEKMPSEFNTHYLSFIILILFSLSPSSHQQSCNSQDEASLLDFLTPITTSSFPPLNWSSSVTCCSWEGVDCNVRGRVIGLRLHSRGLEGQVNPSIKNLVSLTHLDLSKNSLSGNLPAGLFESLSRLKIVNLSFNGLDGNFSSSGALPSKVFSVDISNNNFHGVIEDSMFLGASKLSIFNCSTNGFSGFIPSSICSNSPLLKALDFSYNSFSGSIPPTLLNCTNLVRLIFRANSLEGDISGLNFSQLARIQKLDFSRNMFTGPFPESLYSCKKIVALRLASNYFTGQISPKIVALKSLTFLSLTNNSFTNITSTLRVLAGCKNLTILFLGYNFFGESLPSNSSFLGSNGFPNVQFISLIYCNLVGYIPDWVSSMKNLRILDLSYNRITGTIPKWLDSLPKLFALDLSHNFLSGEIPDELCLLPALVSANVSNLNRFHFDLPVFSIFPGRRTWDQFVVYPPQIILQNNNLSGIIPPEIGKLQNLYRLYLNGNNLSGGIPFQISYLKNLEQLSLAQNHLSGDISPSLARLNFLSSFNVSYNDLQGQIPVGGQFETFPASSYDGNPGLCGQVLNRPCSSTKNVEPDGFNDEGGEGDGWHSFIDGLAVGFASGFSCILAFVASCAWYKLTL